jgi:hypothetical protein
MCISWHRGAVRALLGTGLLLLTLLPARAQPTPRCGSSNDTIPSGLAVVLPSGRYQSLNLQALSNPFMSGVAVQINWRDIEPVQGRPDWSKLDELFTAAESSKRWVQLAIFPGFFSPTWALEGAKTDLFEIQYGPGHGTVTKLPMPWDRVYLDRWFAFVKQLSERYARSPAFRVPDRGSGNPTPLGGVGLRHYPCRLRGWKRTNVAATLFGTASTIWFG